MKALFTITVVAVLAISIISCDKKAESEESAAEETEKVAEARQQVIAIHDEAMPLMSDLYSHKKIIRARIAATPALSAEKKTEADALLQKLDSADQSMRVWMRKFSEVKTTDVSEDEALANLKAEGEKISKVKDQMNAAVKAADTFEKANP